MPRNGSSLLLSRRSILFAHRVLWFLHAFAPDSRYASKLCRAIASRCESSDQMLRIARSVRMLRQPHSPMADAVFLRGSLCARRSFLLGALAGNHVHAPVQAGEQRNAALAAVRQFGLQAMQVFTDAMTAATGLVRGRGGSAGSVDSAGVDPGNTTGKNSGRERGLKDDRLHRGSRPGVELSRATSQLSIDPGAQGTTMEDGEAPPGSLSAPLPPGGSAGTAAPGDSRRSSMASSRAERVHSIETRSRQDSLSSIAGASAGSSGAGGGAAAASASGSAAGAARPSHGPRPAPAATPGPTDATAADAELFLRNVRFCEQLSELSRDLKAVPVPERNDRLRHQLRAIDRFYCGQDRVLAAGAAPPGAAGSAGATAAPVPLTNGLVYVPVGNCHNTLLKVHPENSFCFRTKERVPFMVVFEVLEYADMKGGPIRPREQEGGRGGSAGGAAGGGAAGAAADTVRWIQKRLGFGGEGAEGTTAAERAAEQTPLRVGGVIPGTGPAGGVAAGAHGGEAAAAGGSSTRGRAASSAANSYGTADSPPPGVLPSASASADASGGAGRRGVETAKLNPLQGLQPADAQAGRGQGGGQTGRSVANPLGQWASGAPPGNSGAPPGSSLAHGGGSGGGSYHGHGSASSGPGNRGRDGGGAGGGGIPRTKSGAFIDSFHEQQHHEEQQQRGGGRRHGSGRHAVGTLHSPLKESHDEEEEEEEEEEGRDSSSMTSPRLGEHRGSLDSTGGPDGGSGISPRLSPARHPVSSPMYASSKRSEELDRPLMLPSPTLPPSSSSSSQRGSGPHSRSHLPAPEDSRDLEEQLASKLDPALMSHSAAAAAAGASQGKQDGESKGAAHGSGSAASGSGSGEPGEGQREKKSVSVAFPDPWATVEAVKRRESRWGHLPGWRLVPVIVKANDDLRQEQFVSQLLRVFQDVWEEKKTPVWVRAYDILATSKDGGMIEAVPDTISLDSLKRADPNYTTLRDFYARHWGGGSDRSAGFRKARDAFLTSLAGYSIICYLLNIKDRHNANILIDREGRVLHIDFGFLLSNSPGGNMNFENAPFKLTADFIDLLGGTTSAEFEQFRRACAMAFIAARQRYGKIMLMVEVMLDGNEDLPCFRAGKVQVMRELRERFALGEDHRDLITYVNNLIDASANSWRTGCYDAF